MPFRLETWLSLHRNIYRFKPYASVLYAECFTQRSTPLGHDAYLLRRISWVGIKPSTDPPLSSSSWQLLRILLLYLSNSIPACPYTVIRMHRSRIFVSFLRRYSYFFLKIFFQNWTTRAHLISFRSILENSQYLVF